jgi:hypothetical protein
VPYGVYDIAGNTGWVSVGIDHDTASFAVNAIRRWWQGMGRARYPEASSLLVTADCGGSNGARVRLWKRELQALANELGIAITVCHLPPGTSKWNKACPREGGDRAPAILIHHSELARQATGQLSDHCATDRRNHDAHRPERQM